MIAVASCFLRLWGRAYGDVLDRIDKLRLNNFDTPEIEMPTCRAASAIVTP